MNAGKLQQELPCNYEHEISVSNAKFWNTLCGSHLAMSLGVTDHSVASLKKFDDWYFNFYPYLETYIPFSAMHGAQVLEVGLGYGSVAQRLAAAQAVYTGLDIAEGPVKMTNYRLALGKLNGRALVGNILAAPFPPEMFDYVIAIGCYHHTGNLYQALAETHRVLRPGGTLIVMVYNAYSYRQWLAAFGRTVRYFFWDYFRIHRLPGTTSAQRAAYDTDLAGAAAPHTDFTSRRSLCQMCHRYASFTSRLENIDRDLAFRMWSRERLLATPLPSLIGLDIYAVAKKSG